MAVRYQVPDRWVKYDALALVNELTNAKAAVLSLTTIPYQRSWAESLQEMELKREVAGTSRIEGAEFTDQELDVALLEETPEDALTRSQRQARAAKSTYRWIVALPDDRPINADLIREVHRRVVTGCDDDHCPPGELRSAGHNVTFGEPRHRGTEGGQECLEAFQSFCEALYGELQEHDPLIQALTLHYHLGSMHPFHDGNGRTARALEALVLQRTGLKDELFIAMSNYYYDEKPMYLKTLSEARANNYDLTPFLAFGLRGITKQCRRLLDEIRVHVAKSLYHDVMYRMYGRLRSTRKRALAHRQVAILEYLIDNEEPIELDDLYLVMFKEYHTLRAPGKALIRDLNSLIRLKAIKVNMVEKKFFISVRLKWATEITETTFYSEINRLPEAKTRLVLAA